MSLGYLPLDSSRAQEIREFKHEFNFNNKMGTYENPIVVSDDDSNDSLPAVNWLSSLPTSSFKMDETEESHFTQLYPMEPSFRMEERAESHFTQLYPMEPSNISDKAENWLPLPSMQSFFTSKQTSIADVGRPSFTQNFTRSVETLNLPSGKFDCDDSDESLPPVNWLLSPPPSPYLKVDRRKESQLSLLMQPSSINDEAIDWLQPPSRMQSSVTPSLAQSVTHLTQSVTSTLTTSSLIPVQPYLRQQLRDKSSRVKKKISGTTQQMMKGHKRRRVPKKIKLSLTNITPLNKNLDDNKCPICLSKIKLKQKITFLNCMHKFHSFCINKQYKMNKKEMNKKESTITDGIILKCPMCKEPHFKTDFITFNIPSNTLDERDLRLFSDLR